MVVKNAMVTVLPDPSTPGLPCGVGTVVELRPSERSPHAALVELVAGGVVLVGMSRLSAV